MALQLQLRDRVRLRGMPRRVHTVAGADISYDRGSDLFFAAVVVLDAVTLQVQERVVARGKSPFPYIPGLLSFREGPLLVRAFKRLRTKPDVALFDGHGIAHPRGVGIASHMGLALDLPTIGCAKKVLVGEYRTPPARRGAESPLRHEGRRIGTVLRTRPGVKPIFVSPGHRVSVESAGRWTLRFCDGFRLPEPTRQAHLLANEARQEARS